MIRTCEEFILWICNPPRLTTPPHALTPVPGFEPGLTNKHQTTLAKLRHKPLAHTGITIKKTNTKLPYGSSDKQLLDKGVVAIIIYHYIIQHNT
jgi:hypothetical protein